MTAESASLIAGPEQAKVELKPWTTRIREVDDAAETNNGDLGVVERAMRSSKGRVAACKNRVDTLENRGHETWTRMSKTLGACRRADSDQ